MDVTVGYMTTTPHEVLLDERRRTSLARVGQKDHAKYLAQEFEDGSILLTPAITVSQTEYNMLRNPEVIAALEVSAANDPSARRRRPPPRRRPG